VDDMFSVQLLTINQSKEALYHNAHMPQSGGCFFHSKLNEIKEAQQKLIF
jgi:hypothetical protein